MSGPAPTWLWPAADLGRGLPLLASAGGLRPSRADEEPPPMTRDEGEISHLNEVAAWQGLELEPFSAGFKDMAAALRRCGPALIRRPASSSEPEGWLLLLGPGRRGTVRLLGRDGAEHRRSVAGLSGRLAEPLVGDLRPQTESLLERAGVPSAKRPRAVRALLEQRLGERAQELGFLVRGAPGDDFTARLGRAGVFRAAATVVVCHALQYVLWLAAWWLIGRTVLGGQVAGAWIVAWALLLAASVPLRMATSRAMGLGSLRAAGELKRRLMHGALSLDRDATRSEGVGGAFGRVLEAEALESLALQGGLITLTALVELPFALWVLSRGTAGSALFGAALLLLGALGLGVVFYVIRLRSWTESRLVSTHRLVEKLAGHQTRRVQESPAGMHRGEDLELKQYLDHSRRVDDASLGLYLWPRCWLPIAFAVLMPAAVTIGADGSEVGSLAVAVGGILLLQGVASALTAGLSTLGRAWISWDKVAPLFAAGRSRAADAPAFVSLPTAPADEPTRDAGEDAGSGPRQDAPTLLAAADLSFRHCGRARPVLDRVGLTIAAGDRVLLEGPSGGGKSTLASLLVGLRAPDSGSLTLWGLDRATIGPEPWRRRVVLVPQFHDNHIGSKM